MAKRIITWAGFIIVVGLIIWGMVVAEARKASRPVATPDTLPSEVTDSDWKTSVATTTVSTSTKKVTMVEYSDFQCPACGAYFPVVEKLMIDLAGKVDLVYRHFPLPQHQNAILAAAVSEAAGKQGKFWDMYRLLFGGQSEWSELSDSAARDVFLSYAKKLELDTVKFTSDIDSKEIRDKITASVTAGNQAGIAQTPTFYVNGKRIENPNSYDSFKTLLEEAAK